jgi:hypothetical protein
LIEVLAAAGKTQPQTVIQMDMSHDGKPPIHPFRAPFV